MMWMFDRSAAVVTRQSPVRAARMAAFWENPMQTIDTRFITDAIANLGHPIYGEASEEALWRWLDDPLLSLTPDQRLLIERALAIAPVAE